MPPLVSRCSPVVGSSRRRRAPASAERDRWGAGGGELVRTWYVASQDPGSSAFMETSTVAVNFWVRTSCDGFDAEVIKQRADGEHPRSDDLIPGTKTLFANQLVGEHALHAGAGGDPQRPDESGAIASSWCAATGPLRVGPEAGGHRYLLWLWQHFAGAERTSNPFLVAVRTNARHGRDRGARDHRAPEASHRALSVRRPSRLPGHRLPACDPASDDASLTAAAVSGKRPRLEALFVPHLVEDGRELLMAARALRGNSEIIQ